MVLSLMSDVEMVMRRMMTTMMRMKLQEIDKGPVIEASSHGLIVSASCHGVLEDAQINSSLDWRTA